MTHRADVELVDLTDHLLPHLATRIRELVDADSRAQRIVELEQRTQRAQDLVAEIRRHMKYLQRDRDKVLEDAAAAIEAERASEERRLGPPDDAGLIGNWLGGFAMAAGAVRKLKGTP